MDEKRCTVCEKRKPLLQFDKSRGGLRSRCKSCQREAYREWRLKNLDKVAAYKQKWFQEHREQTRESHRRYYETHKEESAAAGRRYRYGITAEEHAALLKRQDGLCAICGTDTPRGRGTWHVDHDHETGKVRALLCNGCNLGIGHFQDSPELLLKAAQYLASQVPAQEAARALI